MKLQAFPIKSKDPTYDDQVVKFYYKPMHNTVVYFAVLLDATTRIFIQRSIAIKASRHISDDDNPNFKVLKSHYYFKGIELNTIRSDEGVNASKYQYEILPEAREQIIPATATNLLILPSSSNSNCQSSLQFEKTIIYHENGTVGNETLKTRLRKRCILY